MKIGFLALSGIRVVDEEMMALGVNLPGFVERSEVIASLPSLGLLTLAALTPPDVAIDYVEVPDAAKGRSLPGPFDVVAISSLSATILEAYALADRYREAGVQVVLGGLHVSSCPEEASQHADAVMIGEGEPLWPKLVEDLKRGQLQGIYDSRSTPYNLADAPIPRFDLLDPDRYNRITVQTQRGCPWNCEFCAASIRLAPGFKTKPIDKVVAEINAVKAVWESPFIEFADDNTFANKRRGRELARAMRDLDVRWFTETDISIAEDPVLLRELKPAGCAQILVGLESPDAAELQGVELKRNWKQRQRDQYLRSIARIQDAGVTVNGCFVLGLDTQTVESFETMWQFIQDSGLYEVQITVMTAFPGTPLYRRMVREGRMIDSTAWNTCTLFDVNFQPAQMSVDDLRTGLMELGKRVYSAEFTEQRRRKFFRRQKELIRGGFIADSA
ncbi:B12-binding domain-containing radical SAM protein [Coraliomargarita akajimensis]|uniref:Radical SAM domain protein n=1 Tax=Coraliomargarita akajimensis (strain DSM 45221 / IAM 15411 / JCM 23193 / KCTC 12865 / 04OKA010-24) TaxID=583355 RepID=D5EQC0_CORAD|nr:B12-binding domain-containing radical SAM protein [Coraliomargarita akajimensis]ADE53888.1 Radical SAM domain protein [Coraliomargarita akajimensis DSM 45221]